MRRPTDPKDQLLAQRLIAAGELTDEQIAVKCKIGRATLARWKKQKGFAAEVAKLRMKRAEGADKAATKEGFDTVQRLIELASLSQDETNGNIQGQVRACGLIAEIRQELVKLHGDVTERLRGKTTDELDFIAIHRRDPKSPQELAEFVESLAELKTRK